MVKQIIVFIMCSISFLFLSACWDRIEIEDRGFVVGSAIDLVEKKDNNKYEILLTNQFVIPAGLGTPQQGGGAQQKAYKNITLSGESVFEIIREMATLSSEAPFFAHLKVVIISDKVAKEPELLPKVLDVFIRDHEMRRGIKVLITEEGVQAKDTLDILPDDQKVPALYIESLMESNYKSARALKPVPVGQLQELMLNNRSYALPEISIVNDKSLDYKNAAVIRAEENLMVDSLSDKETIGLTLLTERDQNVPIHVDMDGESAVVELTSGGNSFHFLNTDKDNLKVEIRLNLKATVAEIHGSSKIVSESFIKRLERATENKIAELTEGTIKVSQKDLQVDIIGLGDEVFHRHYDLWQQVKNDWDTGKNYFSKAEIVVKVDTTIKKTGASDNFK
ncbi:MULTISPECIES: Ger(x)C family spore germination protein [Clostridia]|uniref:Ger(x)C family spore germination protein n=1 Tax=Clostridia TaxID=186801 RepID=UPI0013141E8A|nr:MULTISPECIES: Ger(x)C family spore germination protein [Clostridia]